MSGDSVLSLDKSILACLAWVVAWGLSHCLCCHGGSSYDRRLWRSQAYCCLAVIGALRLLSRAHRVPEDLLFEFGMEHQILFSMAVGHWLVSIWEDCKNRGSLGRGLDSKSFRGVRDPSQFLLRAYVVHHVVAAGGYFALLSLQRCSGVGTFGLLFELPVLMLNRREIALRCSPVPSWLRRRSGVIEHWWYVRFLFLVGRGGPILVYLYSLLFWRDHLGALTVAELAVYHGLTIFFALLNYAFLFVLQAWARFDLDSVAQHIADEDEDFGSPVHGDASPVNADAAPLQDVPPERLASMCGASPDEPIWIGIDGAAYDVTAFLRDCPCGEQVLRKWAGQDASEAFHAARHSHSAKTAMARYMVGHIKSPPSSYRLFEHGEQECAVLSMLSSLTLGLALKVAAVSSVFVGSVLPAGGSASTAGETSASASGADLMLASFLLAATTGVLATIFRLVSRSHAMSWDWSEHAFALGLLVYQAGFVASCQGLLSGRLSSLELGAGALLIIEALVEPRTNVRFDRLAGFLAPVAAILWSWYSRDSLAQDDAAQPVGFGAELITALDAYAERGFSALVLASSLSFSLRRLGRAGQGQKGGGVSRERMASSAKGGLQLSGLYGFLGVLAMVTASPSASARLGAMTAELGVIAPRLVVSSAGSLTALLALFSCAVRCSPAFASRSMAFGFAFVGLLAGGFGGRSWLAALGFLAHLASLAARNRLTLHDASDTGRFADVPPHVIGAQALWDHARVFLGNFVWRLTVLRVADVINALLPRELRVFASETVFPNVGHGEDRTYLGVAAHFAPRKARGQKQMPQYFVCNVGQIFHNALTDMQMTMNTLIDVWGEFQVPEMKGLLANVVAVFPDVEDQRVAKEINLSAWESARDAHNWYVRSPGHKNALFQHSSGILKTFGNLLASLEPTGAMRHQDRCRQCSRLVEAREMGVVAPSRCSFCGGRTFRYPLF